ncbi:beta-lactamase family protein [Hypoxylon rubiginosum]|uniref:Beta-lactamase family protein n=1 Tax=Hypoxylon rubiginosum TaxID=110542 RepID=A0ACC0D932_9PEZI|nr:beta-lactamase family protein [Hypoxylon rubiginosum]
MTSLDDLLESAVKDGTAPGIVVIAKDKDGKVDIAEAFSSEKGTPYSLDTVMEVSSMTKFPTSIAALQLVERGLVTLDEDVSHLIPSFAKQGILESVADDGTPTVRERQNPITLRRLITHSSGAGYSFLDEKLGKVRASQFELPLIFEPGEGWAYGTGIDRVGHVVEKLTGLSLEEYMKQNIWGPLGAENSTFFPDQDPAITARRVPMSFREDPNGPAVEKPGAQTVTTGAKLCFGGHGLLGSMPDYFKMVYSLLVDDEKLLKKETAALMFQPQLTPASRKELHKFMETPNMKLMFPSPPHVDRDYGLGGLLIVGDEHDFWRKGALMWGGAASLNWFIDRDAGVCGVFGAQVQPSDARMRKLIDAFQADVYREAGKLT